MSEAEELIRSGTNDRLEEMLEADPSLANQKTGQGISLLQFAAYCRNEDAVHLLRKLTRNPDVFEAASIGEVETVKALLEKHPGLIDSYAADGFTPLGLASFFGQTEMVNWLIEKGADPNKSSDNPFKVTPLHSACAVSHYEIAALLLKAGADVNAAQMQGVTPLHSAAHNGQTGLIKLLVEYGADLMAHTDDGKTPLSLAEEGGHSETTEYLKKLGGR